MTLSKDETMDLLDELTHYGLASTAEEIENIDEDLYEIVKKFYPINCCPTYIEDELIGLKETLQLASQCYKNALENIKGYLLGDLEALENNDKGLEMHKELKKVKKVISKDADKEMKAMKGLEKKDKVMDKKMEKCESTMSKKKK